MTDRNTRDLNHPTPRPPAIPAEWTVPVALPPLGAGQALVWRVRLDQEDAVVARAARRLDAEESARAARFRAPREGLRYTVAHAALRLLLAGYTGRALSEITYREGKYGKPEMAQPGGELRFNLAHSHDTALIALVLGVEVGVDIERLRRGFAFEPVARRVLAPEELAALREVEPEAREAAFFDCWTLKEALLKARGCGFAGGADAHPVWDASGPVAPPGCTAALLAPGEGFTGALAVLGPIEEIACYEWSPERDDD